MELESLPTDIVIRQRLELSATLGRIAQKMAGLQRAQTFVLKCIYEHNEELHARGINAIEAMEHGTEPS